jgi:hypothetical protein
MRTTIDIPDELYREIRIEAAQRGTTVRQIVLDGVEKELRATAGTENRRKKFEIPVIQSSSPGTLHLTNEEIDDILAAS